MRFELFVAAMLPLAAVAEPVTPAEDGATAAQVAVIRGKQIPIQSRHEQGVIVMRPERGSFMRETKRLAAEAEARDERAARREARETNLRLTSTLRTLENAAAAVQQQRHGYHFLVLAPANARSAADRRTARLPPVSTGTPPAP
jgi:hypothetical protein